MGSRGQSASEDEDAGGGTGGDGGGEEGVHFCVCQVIESFSCVHAQGI